MKHLLAAFLLAACAIGPSGAQGADNEFSARAVAPTGEVIVEADGRVRPPWSVMRVCPPSGRDCVDAVVNSETREIAKVGDQWASPFSSVGTSDMVRRISDDPSPYVKGRSGRTPIAAE
jgi:hypothetical protein